MPRNIGTVRRIKWRPTGPAVRSSELFTQIPLLDESSILRPRSQKASSSNNVVTTDAKPRTARIVHSIAEIPAAAWNVCANPGGAVPHNPFVDHAFLHA